MTIAPVRYLYRDLASASHYADRLTLLPNDRVRYRTDEAGIDVLVLLEDGGSFDRARASPLGGSESADELSEEVNASLRFRWDRSWSLSQARTAPRAASRSSKSWGAQERDSRARDPTGARDSRNLFFRRAARAGRNRSRLGLHRPRMGPRVGLCQVGAYGMAASGFSYRDILSHYYPGTRIDKHHAHP
jgi:hypothetical protein